MSIALLKHQFAQIVVQRYTSCHLFLSSELCLSHKDTDNDLVLYPVFNVPKLLSIQTFHRPCSFATGPVTMIVIAKVKITALQKDHTQAHNQM